MTTEGTSRETSADVHAATATLEAAPTGAACVVNVGGDWQLNESVPAWTGVLGQRTATSVRVVPKVLGKP